MSWLSSTNPFEYGHGGYGYGSSGYNVGDVHTYEFDSSRYGEPYGAAAPQYAGDSYSSLITPRKSVDCDYCYEAEPPNNSESLSGTTAYPPIDNRNQRYEREQAYELYTNQADQSTFSSRYNTCEEKPYYANRYKSFDEEPGYLFRTASKTYNFNALETNPVVESSCTADAEVTEASEEVLIKIRGAVAHLVDDRESPLLGEGDFSIVLIEQAGNGIVAFVRVGDNLRWPLTKDEPAVKLDASHYFFTIRVPLKVDEMDKETAHDASEELLSYGVTFPAEGQEEQLRELDDILERYSRFLSPKLVRGNKETHEIDSAFEPDQGSIKQGKLDESSEYWRNMAPNVDDYNSDLAKAFAMGTGSLIKGIFWLRDSTVAGLENGSSYVRDYVRPTSKPSNINPHILLNLKRVMNMSIATEAVASSVLNGVIRAAGFFSGALIKSELGKRFFRLLPGEVALVSMDAFAKLFDALEAAGYDVATQTKMFTQDIVSHRYGEQAGELTGDSLITAGHIFATAWTVTKVRSAWNPTKFKPTRAGMLKAAAKAVMHGAK